MSTFRVGSAVLFSLILGSWSVGCDVDGATAEGVGGVGGEGIEDVSNPCLDPSPLVEGDDTGFGVCADGTIVRLEIKACPQRLPRDITLEPPSSGASCVEESCVDDDCLKDSDCADGQYCGLAHNGVFQENYWTCLESCVTDGDCRGSEICVCGEDFGTCQPTADCRSNADCDGDLACQAVENRSACGGLKDVSFGCQTEEDECRSREDCDGGACIKSQDAWVCYYQTCE